MKTLRWLPSLLLLLVCALDAGAAELAVPRDGYRIGALCILGSSPVALALVGGHRPSFQPF